METPRRHSGQKSSRGPSCLARVVSALILLASIAGGAWNLVVHAPWQGASTRPASAAEARIPHTTVNPYSVNTFLSQEVEHWKREKTLQMISDAGIGWITEGFSWSEIEPAKGSYWDPKFHQDSWHKYDEIVSLAERYGVRVIARLDHTPEWARPEDSDHHAPPDDGADYGDFVETFVDRYSGRVQYIQIWNEPNLAREWGGEIDPGGYVELLREAYTRAKSADPDVTILSAPMAMTNEASSRAITEFDYWENLFELGAADYFDVMTATGYGIDLPPEVEPSREVINLRRIELLREILADHGSEQTPIWLTEYGWNASPETISRELLEWGSVSDQDQAEWTSRGIRWMSENWDWFGVSSIWYFRQVGVVPADAPEYYFAMVDLEFTPRPVYLSVREDALEHRVALPGEYGPMEAPVRQTGIWRRSDNPDARFGETIASDTWGAEIRIEFSGTDLTLIPGDLQSLGGWMYATLNGEPAQSHLFSQDHLGRTYLDLDGLRAGTNELPVVERYRTDRPQQTNVFVLHIHEDASLALNAVVVDYQRSYRQFTLLAVLSLGGVALSIMLLRGRRAA